MINISFDVPKEMLDLAQAPDIDGKPYNLCLKCPFMSETCDGPDVLAMEYPRWVEWANERAKQLGLTHAKIAELSNVSKGTVDSVLSGRTSDIRSATMRDITRVLVGGCWGKYPCHFAALLMKGEIGEDADGINELRDSIRKKDIELQDMRRRLDTYNFDRESLIEKVEADAQKKIDYLKELVDRQEKKIGAQESRLEKINGLLFRIISVTAVLALLIVAALVVDRLNPNIGFFWLDRG